MTGMLWVRLREMFPNTVEDIRWARKNKLRITVTLVSFVAFVLFLLWLESYAL